MPSTIPVHPMVSNGFFWISSKSVSGVFIGADEPMPRSSRLENQKDKSQGKGVPRNPTPYGSDLSGVVHRIPAKHRNS